MDRTPANFGFLWWCLPAILAGLILRVTLMTDIPYGYYHDDTPDFLSTHLNLVEHGKFKLHSKKTFLTPLLYSLAFITPFPAIIVIAIGQHLLGLLMILMIGMICRLWFAHWKWFILPITLFAAVNPQIIWYEHTLMAECHYLVAVVFLALAGTWFALDPSRKHFVILLGALFLVAGARPEGKLFFAFGILVVILTGWKNWPLLKRRVPITLGVALMAHLATPTEQSGLLLYTSVVHLTPDRLFSAPGLENHIAPLRERLLEKWKVRPAFAKVRERRELADLVSNYLEEHPEMGKADSRKTINRICKRAAMETCARRPWALGPLLYAKFRSTASHPSSGGFTEYWMREKQLSAMTGNMRILQPLARELVGFELPDDAAVKEYIRPRFKPVRVRWMSRWMESWASAAAALRFPDARYDGVVLEGLPFWFVAATLGLMFALFDPRATRFFHWGWVPMLAGLFVVIILTANVKARFRFVFEPFWVLYIFAIAEVTWLRGAEWIRRIRKA